jgi:hypothetical protein
MRTASSGHDDPEEAMERSDTMARQHSLAMTLKDQHDRLAQELSMMEKAAIAAEVPSNRWLDNRLSNLRSALAEHFQAVEQSLYLSPLLRLTPGIEEKRAEMLVEHRALLQSLDALIKKEDLHSQSRENVREKLLDLVRRVREHEVRENILLNEAQDEDPA